MYSFLLYLHSWNRWAVLILLTLLVVRALRMVRATGPMEAGDVKLARITAILVDVQGTAGLLLYAIFSPITSAAFQNMGLAMKDTILRFWAVEHITGMILAWALVRVGTIKAKKPTAKAGYRTLLIFLGIAFVIMIAAAPWPGMRVDRPLFRL